ncbi:MAG TPA: methyltransferase [Candidatus Binatia bacterium]|jgi:ubiquinone/menaquinone biosynthesis C-methylase UbiE
MIAIADTLARGTLDELGFYFAPQAVLFTALKLGVFEAVGDAARNADDLASAIGCSPRGVRMLLNCMAGMGLVEKQNGRYGLTDLSRVYFLSSGKNYLGSLFICSDQLLKLWLKLPGAVEAGAPALPLLPEPERERLNLDIVEALFHVHKDSAWKLAALCEKTFPLEGQKIKLLDVAAGSAVWSLPFALQSEQVEVTAVDFPPVLEVAKKFACDFGVQNRYSFIPGDIRRTDFGTEAYDLALLGHICHSEGAEWSRRLIDKCFRALKENGRLLIMDYIADEERKTELMPLLLALNALLGTDEGDTFTFSEYRQWLSRAGFTDIQALDIGAQSPVVLALKG